MIERITIKGFQSLYNVDLPLGKFTVIHGESNVGKSAFFRAFKSFVVGESGDWFISDGENKTEVSLSLSDCVVAWQKQRGKSGSYKKGTEIWGRVKSMPKAVQDVLKIGKMEILGETFYPNFRGQFDSMFLLFDSSGKRAKILGDLVANILLQGIRTANLERNRNEADIRSIKLMTDSLQDSVRVKWEDWEQRILNIQDLQERAERIQTGKRRVDELVDKHDRVIMLLESIPYLSFHGDADSILVNVNLLERVNEKASYWKQLKALGNIPEVDVKLVDRCERLVNFAEKFKDLNEDLSYTMRQLTDIIEQASSGMKALSILLEQAKFVENKLKVRCPKCKSVVLSTELEEV
jgi:DNA repair ATPase RecN